MRHVRFAVHALALVIALLADRGAARASEQLDWCAPVVVRPDSRFYTFTPPCTPWWPDDEIARRADLVLGGFLRPSNSAVAPDRSVCFGPSTMENSRAYHERLRALAATYGRTLHFVYQARFDLVDRHTAGTPGLDDDFLVDAQRSWRESTDFFQRDRSPACACGCEWNDAAGPAVLGEPPGQRLRDLVDAVGGAGALERKVVYGTRPSTGGSLAGAPRLFFGIAALADQTNATYRAWRIDHMRDAIAAGGFDAVELNHKFSQYLPGGAAPWWDSATAPDVASYLVFDDTLWSSPARSYGYAEYVRGWAAFADDLVAAGIPYEVNLTPFIWRAGTAYDDASTPDVDEAATIRSVARRARWVLLQRFVQFSEAEFAAVIADIESEGHARVIPYDGACGFGSPPGRPPTPLAAGFTLQPDAAVAGTFTATSLGVSVFGTATGSWDADLWCHCPSLPCGAPDASVTGQTGSSWQPPVSVCDAAYRSAPIGRRSPRVEVRRAGASAASARAVQICPPACANGRDDDRDGDVDAPQDAGCARADDLDESSPTLRCDDGADNDGDRRIDRPADPQCTAPDASEGANRGCGLGAEIALAGLVAGARRPRPRPASDAKSPARSAGLAEPQGSPP